MTWRPIVRTALLLSAFSLSGCVWFAALPAATQVTLVVSGIASVAAVTNADVAVIKEYCDIRDCKGATKPAPKPLSSYLGGSGAGK